MSAAQWIDLFSLLANMDLKYFFFNLSIRRPFNFVHVFAEMNALYQGVFWWKMTITISAASKPMKSVSCCQTWLLVLLLILYFTTITILDTEKSNAQIILIQIEMITLRMSLLILAEFINTKLHFSFTIFIFTKPINLFKRIKKRMISTSKKVSSAFSIFANLQSGLQTFIVQLIIPFCNQHFNALKLLWNF